MPRLQLILRVSALRPLLPVVVALVCAASAAAQDSTTTPRPSPSSAPVPAAPAVISADSAARKTAVDSAARKAAPDSAARKVAVAPDSATKAGTATPAPVTASVPPARSPDSTASRSTLAPASAPAAPAAALQGPAVPAGTASSPPAAAGGGDAHATKTDSVTLAGSPASAGAPAASGISAGGTGPAAAITAAGVQAGAAPAITPATAAPVPGSAASTGAPATAATTAAATTAPAATAAAQTAPATTALTGAPAAPHASVAADAAAASSALPAVHLDSIVVPKLDSAELANAYVQRADSLYQARKVDAAIAEYRRGLVHDPMDIDTWYGLAELYHQEGNLKKAADTYTLALSTIDHAPELRLPFATLLLESKRKGDAMKVLQKGIEIDSTANGEMKSMLGRIVIGELDETNVVALADETADATAPSADGKRAAGSTKSPTVTPGARKPRAAPKKRKKLCKLFCPGTIQPSGSKPD